jgi:hypothetical protein
MSMRATVAAAVLVALVAGVRPRPAAAAPPASLPASLTDTQRKYGLDPTSALESRIGPVPAAFIALFGDDGEAKPTNHVLTAEERRKVTVALAALPPLPRRILTARLRTLSFADGMPNTALTTTINPNDPDPLFDLTIRAGVLNQDVTQFLNNKERMCFDGSSSPLSVSIEAGTRDAILYILLHEAGHMVDSSLGLTAVHGASAQIGPFAAGIWSTRLLPIPIYRDPLLLSIKFRNDGKVSKIDRAPELYTALSRTPFVSLYGSSNWFDDLAEFFALYHLTQKLGQPYRIVIHNGKATLFRYEPMESPFVRARFGQMSRFYD